MLELRLLYRTGYTISFFTLLSLAALHSYSFFFWLDSHLIVHLALLLHQSIPIPIVDLHFTGRATCCIQFFAMLCNTVAGGGGGAFDPLLLRLPTSREGNEC